MPLPYSKKLIELFMNPKNVGEIENPDAKATEGSPACGDMVQIFLKVDPETKRIVDIKFKSYGCASNIATASIVTELAKGKTLEEAKKITWKDADRELGGLPPVKVHCAVLAVDALHTAIENYEHQHGLLKEKKPTDKEKVIKRLKHVIDPRKGLDVIRTKLVKDVEVENGVVRVYVDMEEDEQYAGNVREEIIERLEPLWDVKKVEVIFK
ncbi:MAG: iron-sulfur cluster assembly scaffold protein [Candidatus Hydrothermota bacterium]|nr:iron-sulfur cluster assembly scaffold protein [Candidatus Hydrothermae bacterium]RKY96857.1 MAG: iron-sulfur cluster assembly scaffold protein [Candidatus Hydrothermae bacterium]